MTLPRIERILGQFTAENYGLHLRHFLNFLLFKTIRILEIISA